MNTVYFVRHGENPANILRHFSHRLVDFSLTPRGVQQAEQTAKYFEDREIHEIYASPLKRAIETAQIIARAHNLEVQIIEQFREVNVGHLEADPSKENWELHDRIFNDWNSGNADACFPGGEDYHTLLRRMREGLAQVVQGKSGKNIIIVSHVGIMMTSMSGLCPGIDIADLRRQGMKNCAITELQVLFENNVLQAELKSWGLCDHLSD